jgi:exopolysaccharide production protein ExoZ
MIRNIQMLRGVAATLVVICHSAWHWGPSLAPFAKYLEALGFAGVDLFFVISGFVISIVAHRASSGESGAKAASMFALDRIFRIYPLYWMVAATAAGLAIFVPAVTAPGVGMPVPAWWQIVTLTAPYNPVVSVAWTLCFEMFFYGMVAVILLVSGRFFRVAMLVVAAFYGAVIVLGFDGGFFTNPMILDFLFGVLVFWLVSHERIALPGVSATAGAIGLALGSYLISDHPWAHVMARPFYLGLPAAFLVYGTIGLERSWQSPKLMVAIGNASYSTYLWHWVILRVVAVLAIPVFPSILTGFTVLVALTCVGLLSFRFIEIPIARALRALRYRPNPLPAPAE